MLLVQRLVIDHDFVEEHRMAYAQQHRTVDKWCIRVHAFRLATKRTSPTTNSKAILSFIDKAQRDAGSYVGFATLRPLRHAPVGATFLAIPKESHVTVRARFDVQLTGARLNVETTPFLQQESAAGACAQASIWMALRTLSQRTKRQRVSIAELTMAASRQKRFNRHSPGSDGLTVGEMVEALKSLGLNYFHFDVPKAQEDRGDVVLRTVCPYLDSGLPVILSLRVGEESGHAVVAVGAAMSQMPMLPPSPEERECGCRFSEAWVSHLVVHNDNTGPYQELPLAPPPGPGASYCARQAKGMIIPLPSAILMSAKQSQLLASEMGLTIFGWWFANALGEEPPEQPGIEVVLRPVLCSRHAWRAWTRRATHMGRTAREAYRTASLPELMWVVEVHDASMFDPTRPAPSCCGELLFDAASNSLQGESFVAGRATGHLYPELKSYQEFLIIEDDRDVLFVQSDGHLGPGIDRPDYA
jgi:hypothetical protein